VATAARDSDSIQEPLTYGTGSLDAGLEVDLYQDEVHQKMDVEMVEVKNEGTKYTGKKYKLLVEGVGLLKVMGTPGVDGINTR
jgi:hypothetical protein